MEKEKGCPENVTIWGGCNECKTAIISNDIVYCSICYHKNRDEVFEARRILAGIKDNKLDLRYRNNHQQDSVRL